MAATKYNIYVRYMNNNRVITGQINTDWMSNFEFNELSAFYTKNKTTYESLLQDLDNGVKKKENFTAEELDVYIKCKRFLEFNENLNKGAGVKENVHVEPYDEMYIDPKIRDEPDNPKRSRLLRAMKNAKLDRDAANQQIITNESRPSNPKYDMIFMYQGLGKEEADKAVYNENPTNSNAQITPYVYYDDMKRVTLSPWFFYSQYASLKAAMLKAAELANVMGTDGVLIGKDVALEQYIEIV